MNKNVNLDLIRERLNILDVVSTYIKLDKAGSQFRARCPFHNEKSPSFYVSPSRGSYHCFGCSEHGDIFSFVMKIEGINFKDALRLLADRAGVSISNFQKEEQSNLIDILEQATIFFEHKFSQSDEAKNYLKKRGVNTESIQKFRIGFAPNDWRQLYHALNKAGYTDEEIVTSGLCIKHDKGLYDRFRNRVMFPIMNGSGKVVAFTGRILPLPPGVGGEEPAKYVNSPETPMYHKSAILFGYNFAKQEIARQKKVLVVEGQMDVIMAHQAGNSNTVAISGTAFTPEHISILKRFAETVILALDSDKAGYTAMLKSAGLALLNDLEVEGIKLSEKDPADMILHDIENWKKIVTESKPILSLITEIIIEKEKIKPKQIQLLRKDLFPLLRSIKSPLLKETYSKEIAELLNIDLKIIKEETNEVKTEIELSIKKTPPKKVNHHEVMHLLVQLYAGISIAEETKKQNYLEELKQYLQLDNKYSIETLPEDILNKEIFQLEKKINETGEQFKFDEYIDEVMSLFAKKFLEEKIEESKDEIRKGEATEELLKKLQNFSKMLLSLKM